MTEREREPKTQIFAENRRFSQIRPFSWKFKHLEGAGNRRKSQIFVEHRRFSQKTTGSRRLGSVTLGPSPLARPYSRSQEQKNFRKSLRGGLPCMVKISGMPSNLRQTSIWVWTSMARTTSTTPTLKNAPACCRDLGWPK